MNSLVMGAAIAALVAGYPLYQLVTAGDLDATSALVRGGIVAVACTAGVAAIGRLALGYEAEAATSRTRKLDALFSDMEGAVAAGTLKDDDPKDAADS
jgi:hypothetical protein